jgi:hypothetical protein
MLYTTICLLVLLDVSTATWSPHHHPAQEALFHRKPDDNDFNGASNNIHDYYQSSYSGAGAGDSARSTGDATPRGGSTAVHSPPDELQKQQYWQQQELNPHYLQEQTQEEIPFHPPVVHLKHVSMALRLTSEWNRRLLEGINRLKSWGRGKRLAFQNHYYKDAATHHQQQAPPSGNVVLMDPYGDVPINVHPSRTWQPPIQALSSEDEDEELTVFHAKAPGDLSLSKSDDRNATPQKIGVPRGVCHWGPDLLEYLTLIVEILGVDAEGGVEIPLAMIYIDRACSVETARSNGVAACPFCTPRTVHRLSLVALLIAIEAVHGQQQLEDAFSKLTSLGIPPLELHQMVDWMRAALGDTGPLVTMDQMREWSRSWEAIFSKPENLKMLRQEPDKHQDDDVAQQHDLPNPQQYYYDSGLF